MYILGLTKGNQPSLFHKLLGDLGELQVLIVQHKGPERKMFSPPYPPNPKSLFGNTVTVYDQKMVPQDAIV